MVKLTTNFNDIGNINKHVLNFFIGNLYLPTMGRSMIFVLLMLR